MGSTSRPIRLAIFEADTPQPRTDIKYGGYGGVFTGLLTASAQSMTPPRDISSIATLSIHDIVNDLNSYPALDDIDGILISGSKHNAYDDYEWTLKLVAYTKQAIETGRVKVVGVCFGHQIIGRAMGANVGKSDRGWEVAVTDVDLTPEGKSVFELEKLVSQRLCAHYTIIQ
jgi:GMP synthase-like glutamine amidotransferase